MTSAPAPSAARYPTTVAPPTPRLRGVRSSATRGSASDSTTRAVPSVLQSSTTKMRSTKAGMVRMTSPISASSLKAGTTTWMVVFLYTRGGRSRSGGRKVSLGREHLAHRPGVVAVQQPLELPRHAREAGVGDEGGAAAQRQARRLRGALPRVQVERDGAPPLDGGEDDPEEREGQGAQVEAAGDRQP